MSLDPATAAALEREVHRGAALANLARAQNDDDHDGGDGHPDDPDAPVLTDTDRICASLAAITHALLAADASGAPAILAAAADAAAPQPAEPSTLADDVDSDNPINWACRADSGCVAMSHEHDWQLHVHRVSRCTQTTCPDALNPRHGHLTRSNISEYVGSECLAETCDDAKYRHAHWFRADNPDTPGRTLWLTHAK